MSTRSFETWGDPADAHTEDEVPKKVAGEREATVYVFC